MRSYETIFVVDCDLEEDARNAVIEKIKSFIESSATIENVDMWGMKKLAYPVNYKREGFYVYITLKADPEFPAKLERIYRITDDIIKSIVVKLDK